MLRIALGALLLPMIFGCETIKPYEKEYLLNPLMDDAKVAALAAPLMTSATAGFEKLAGGGASAGGSSCPTCGG